MFKISELQKVTIVFVKWRILISNFSSQANDWHSQTKETCELFYILSYTCLLYTSIFYLLLNKQDAMRSLSDVLSSYNPHSSLPFTLFSIPHFSFNSLQLIYILLIFRHLQPIFNTNESNGRSTFINGHYHISITYTNIWNRVSEKIIHRQV